MTVKYAIDAVAQRKPGFIPLKAQIPGNTHLFRPVYLRRFIFSRGGGGLFLGSRSGVAPSASSNLYTISEQYL